MKKIFAVLLSLHMIIAPVAIAQTAGDQFRANPDAKPAGMDYMEIIKSMVIGAVGTSAIQCAMAARLPSILTFSAASIAYIATEMMAGKDQGNFLKKKAADIEMLEEKMKGVGGAGEVQRATLEAALQDEREILKIVTKKLKGIKTVSNIMKLATAFAVMEAIMSKIPPYIFPDPAGCNPASMKGTQLMVGKGLSAAYGYTGMKSGGAVSGIAAFGAAYAVSQGLVGTMLGSMMNTAVTRIAAFGLASMMLGSTSGKLEALKTTVEGNIAKLESVLKEFDKNTYLSDSTINGNQSPQSNPGANPTTIAGGTINTLPGANSLAGNAIDPLANVSSNMSENCWTNSAAGPVYSTNCKEPMKLARPDINAEINVPTLRDASNYSMDYAQAVASGDSAKADAVAGSFNSMASRIDDVNKGLLKQFNDERKKKGEAPYDIEAEKAKLSAQLDGSIQSGLKSNGFDMAALSKLNVLGGVAEADGAKQNITGASADVVASIPGNGMPKINEGITNSESAITEGDTSEATSLEESLKQYEGSESDISDRADESIFKQVSNRYFANYPKFFKRKEVSEQPASEPAKK